MGDYPPIDRKWIDIPSMLPADTYESPGATLWFDGEWWVLIAFVHQRVSGDETLIVQKFKVE